MKCFTFYTAAFNTLAAFNRVVAFYTVAALYTCMNDPYTYIIALST